MRANWRRCCGGSLLVLGLCLSTPVRAENGADYSELDLNELAALSAEVFSASRKTQRLVETPASVYVIEREEIERSGHTLLPELLRLVPGVEVARITSNRWAISVRGFKAEFASKLLVLIDGRVVYTPIFSGVYWNLQDVPLQDVERIEVIRGPGAAIWGSNAVNGVINVITRAAHPEDRSSLSMLAGNEERGALDARVSGGNESLAYRFYGKASAHDSALSPEGHARSDAWRMQRTGLRVDAQPGEHDQLSLDGAVYHGDSGNTLRNYTAQGLQTGIPTDEHVSAGHNGGHWITHWRRAISDTQSAEVQAYYDQLVQRDDGFEETRHALSLDLQHRIELLPSNELIWGAGYRRSAYHTNSSSRIVLADNDGADVWYSGFVQDEHRLTDALRITLGTKVEWNSFSAWEVQPSARGIWLLDDHQQVWAAVSRAVRTPSLGESEGEIIPTVIPPGTIPGVPVAIPVRILGTRLDPERLLAYELGYRTQLSSRLSLDVSGYWHDYDDLIRQVQLTPISGAFQNSGGARALGAEALADWHALARWRVTLGYSLFDLRARAALAAPEREGTPRQQWRASSYMSLPWNVQLDSTLYFVDEVSEPAGNLLLATGDHTRVDLRLGWQARPGLLLELVGQNVLDRHHSEGVSLFSPESVTQIERSIYARVTLRF